MSQAEIDQHLSLGMNLLARGAYSDALSHFHAAVDADPSNYMSYYKRATVYLAMSRSRPALSDLPLSQTWPLSQTCLRLSLFETSRHYILSFKMHVS